MIYRYKAFFRFVYVEDGEPKTYNLPEEPINWDKVDIILKRDNQYHGLNYQFTDGDIQLEFAEDCGLSIIESIYSKDGSDGHIILQFGFIINGVEQVEYEGKLNLNTRKWFKNRVSCTLENSGFHEVINSRLDTKINLFDTKSLDGIVKQNRSANITLHSKKISKFTSVKSTTENQEVFQGFPTDSNFYFTFDMMNNSGDINEFTGSGFSIIDFKLDDPAIDDFQYEIVEGGNYNFDFDLRYKIIFGVDASSRFVNIFPWTVKVVLRVLSGGVFTEHVVPETNRIGQEYINGTNNKPFAFDFEFYHKSSINLVHLNPGDKVYIYGIISITPQSVTGVRITYSSINPVGEGNEIEIIKTTALTEQEESASKGILIYEALTSALESVTNQQNAIDSEVFGRIENGYIFDGEYSKFILTNGFFVRNFGTDRALTTSLKEIFNSLQAIFGIGISYEFEDGVQRLKIEPVNYYYGDQEIIRIEDCDNYTEDTAKEFIYNEIKIGYSKYPDEGEYLLDEFNTELEFLTPIKTNKETYEKKSEFIASGFAIEETRREQFAEKPKDSTTYDDNVFIVSVVNVDGTWKSERQENFTIENVIDPASSYNVSISPKRNLIRHAMWINSGLFYKKGFEIIRNTLFKMNGEARTKKSTEADFIQEKGDIILNNFNDRKQIFKPNWISFKCRLSFSEIQEIKSAHIQKGHLKKNGYVSVMNSDGIWKSGYVFDMTFNPSREEVTIKMLERAENQAGVTCESYADFTFENFESSTLPTWIEDCKFANFN